MFFRVQLAVLILAMGACTVRAEDWPMFGRDQTRNAVSPEKNPPTGWQIPELDRDGKVLAPGKNIRWSTTLNDAGGYGHTYGDPIVMDGMVWIGTMQFMPDAAVLLCLDEKTGKVLYRYVSPRLDWKMGQERPPDWPRMSMACSPLIEGD